MSTKMLLFVLPLILGTECKLPNYINVCKESDPNINDCIVKSVYNLLPNLRIGIPELNVPALEPFHIHDTTLHSGSDEVHIGAVLKDVLVWNASSFQILNMKAIISENYFEYHIVLPQLQLTGNYIIDTTILSLHLAGNGPLSINVTDVRIAAVLKGSIIVRNGVKHLKFDNMKFKMAIGGAKVKLENLFNGNFILGKATNDIINDNTDMFYDAIKPSIEDALEELFIKSANGITGAFEYDELFPK